MEFHDHLKTRIVFSGKLITKSNFRIGSSEDIEFRGADMPILRISVFDNQGNEYLIPYIPSSSIKGVLRSEFCRIINILEPDEKIARENISRIFGGKTKKKHSTKEEYTDIAALLKIQDCLPLDYQPNVSEKTSVTINRKRRAAMKEGLFDVEVVHPETKFNFKAILDNVEPESNAYKALDFIMNELATGKLPLGGGTSRGYGCFELSNFKIEYYFTAEQILRKKAPKLLTSIYLNESR